MGSEARAQLPFVDEHRVVVSAPSPAVWRALGESLRQQAGAAGPVAHLLSTAPRRTEGDPLTTGSSIPGFAVAEAVPATRLVLAGRHRFSEYTLTFTLVERDGATELAATTHARFPGPHGRAYRALVIGSGGHRMLVRRWVQRIGAAAQAG